MEFTGKTAGLSRDYLSGQITISLTVNEPAVVASGYDAIKDVDKLSIKIVKYRNKRSLDANAYYWQLLTKLAEAINVSKTRAHNMILREYGQLYYFDGQVAPVPIPDTEQAENEALDAATFHIKPTSQVKTGNNGIVYRIYNVLRGSSDYDTMEMSKLIDGLVSECKNLGIETLPPVELEKMMKAWRP